MIFQTLLTLRTFLRLCYWHYVTDYTLLTFITLRYHKADVTNVSEITYWHNVTDRPDITDIALLTFLTLRYYIADVTYITDITILTLHYWHYVTDITLLTLRYWRSYVTSGHDKNTAMHFIFYGIYRRYVARRRLNQPGEWGLRGSVSLPNVASKQHILLISR